MQQWDVFLSHASEDKEEVVLPLAEKLRSAGVRIWLDRFQIQLGDSIRQKIDHGLSNSRFGVVILSQAFFAKGWPNQELDALWSLQNLIPVLHGIDGDEVRKYSPLLAGRLSASTAHGLDAVANQIAARVFSPPAVSSPDGSNLHTAREFAVLLATQPAPDQIVSFVAEHPAALISLMGVEYENDFFAASVRLGPNLVDFVTGKYAPSVGRVIDHSLIFFGPACTSLVKASGDPDEALTSSLSRATAMASWLKTNHEAVRGSMGGIGPRANIKVVVGRRPQPDSAGSKYLNNLNDDLIGRQVRTYDWILDRALAIVGKGEP